MPPTTSPKYLGLYRQNMTVAFSTHNSVYPQVPYEDKRLVSQTLKPTTGGGGGVTHLDRFSV